MRVAVATKSVTAFLMLLGLVFGGAALAQDTEGNEAFQLPPAGDGGFQIPGLPPSFGGDDGGVIPGEEVKFEGWFVVEKGARKGAVALKATSAPFWHVYSVTQSEEGLAPQKSEIKVVGNSGVKVTGDFVPNIAPEVHESDIFDVPEEYHAGEVIWTAPIELPEGFDAENDKIEIHYTGQVCKTGGSCIPQDVNLEVSFKEYVETIETPTTQPAPKVAEATPDPLSVQDVMWVIGFGLIGGLILNLMPCVLPVIGLKVFGFIEQAGESRAKILSLNLWYTAGLISVFLVLATMSAFLNLGWGEQFTNLWFKVGMICLVFSMALSFLGVWEIPIPGFVGTGTTVKLQEKEGVIGAFSKGVFTTILATPCSGPFLGPLFGYTLGQPAYVSYLVFISIGVGMASPYIAIGFFPELVRFLPKPGAWMETFKQIMGFLLLATVVFLFTTLGEGYFIATLALLVGVWFACWLIGRVPFTASQGNKTAAWVFGILVAGAVGFGSFSFLTPQRELLEWTDYSEAALVKAQEEGKTVMIDFTADWCLTCKVNLKVAINTNAVKEVVEENGVVPMLADWTEPNDQIKAKLAELNSKSIPVLAIYPAGRPEDVIILRDLVGKQQVVEALEKAGPSQGVESASVEAGSVQFATR